jgi:hypothetical protein
MLKDAKAFSGFAVDDVARAKEFYGTTLELEVADASLGVEGAGVPDGLELRLEPGTRVLYETPRTDAKGIHRTPEVHPVAWFRDPAGNILSIVQE